MDIRYYRDPETGLPHIYHHGVTEAEVEWMLSRPGEDETCSGDSREEPLPDLRAVFPDWRFGQLVANVVSATPSGTET